jgi:hypothetical protein
MFYPCFALFGCSVCTLFFLYKKNSYSCYLRQEASITLPFSSKFSLGKRIQMKKISEESQLIFKGIFIDAVGITLTKSLE